MGGRGYPLHGLCAFEWLHCKSREEDCHYAFGPDDREDDPGCTKQEEHAHPNPMEGRPRKQQTPKAIQGHLRGGELLCLSAGLMHARDGIQGRPSSQ